MDKIRQWKDALIKNRKRCLAGYAVICVLYLITGIAMPHDQLYTKGLEGVRKPSLTTKTAEISDSSRLEFYYEVEGDALHSISFYFTDNGHLFKQGTISLTAYNADTMEELGAGELSLEQLEVETFAEIPMNQPVSDQKIYVVITGHDITDGPGIWLNTEADTPAESFEDGQELENNFIYNAIYAETVHYVKRPVITFLMLLLLGMMVYAVSGSEKLIEKKRKDGNDRQSGNDRNNQKRRQGILSGFTMKVKGFCRKHRQLFGMGLLVLLVALIFYYVYDVQIRKAMNSTEQVVVMKDNMELLPVTEDCTDIIQTYYTEEENLVGLGVRVDLPEDAALQGTIQGSVKDETAGETLCEINVDAATLLDEQYIGFIFDNSQSDVKGHEYTLSFHFSEELVDSGLSMIVTPEGYYEKNTMLVNGEESGHRLSMNAHIYFNLFLKKYFFAMFVFFELFAITFYYMTFIRKCRIETTFLLTVLCLGTIYNFLIVPYMTPDEKYHIDMSYRHSNDLLGMEQAGENQCLKRADDAEVEFTPEPSLTNYKQVYDGLFTLVKDDTMVEAEATANTEAPLVVYLPAVLGMTIARLLHFGTIPMLLFARWCSVLFFGLMTWWGMRKLPFGKAALFLLAILPMNMQQCTSFSYDSVITSVIFLYSCYCIALTYNKEPVKVRDIVVMGALAVIMMYGKSGVYLPMCLLAFMIPAGKFVSGKAQKLCVGGLFLLPILSFINKNTGAVNYVVTTTDATSTVASSATQAYTMGYFIRAPFELITMLANTISDKSAFYLQSIVGQKLGWVEIEISELIPIFFIILLILSVMKTKEEPVYVTAGQKWWVILACGMSFGIILMGMLITWTPVGNVSIEGVQGRYLIPMLLAFSLVGRNKRLMFEKSPDRGLMYAGFIGQLLTVMYLIKAVLVL